jgi:hypothetical protein
MRFVCDTPSGAIWFRIETEGEAAADSLAMRHAVEKYFKKARDEAARCYQPAPMVAFIERDIGLKAHLERTMPMFLTLRDPEGTALVTAMLPPCGKAIASFRCVIVGPQNADPYPAHGASIAALGRHFGLTLDSKSCYPYRQ